MRLRSSLCLLAAIAMATHVCLAGSIKGKVSPGKSVVYLESSSGAAAPASDKHTTMDQKGLLFQPHVLVIQQGTTVEFLNSDKVSHNVFWPSISGDKKKGHNLGTWPTGERKPFRFDQPGVVALLCNVHPEMSGYIIVSPTPYFAETGSDGEFALSNVPDGEYTITAWHEGKKTQSKKITVSGNTTADFALQ